jgi:hypothetical protein
MLSILYNFIGFGLFRIILLLVTGVYLYNLASKSDQEIKRSKSLLMLIGVLLLFANPISAVILLLTVDKVNLLSSNNFRGSPEPLVIKEHLDPEKRKLDILLKLGVFMVVLAGFIFATTSWSGMPDFAKTLFLVFGGVLFFALAHLTGEILGLKKSSIVYYLLGMCFIWFSYYSIGYFGLFGNYLSIGGAGESLYYASNAFIGAFLLYISYKKYENNSLLTPTYLLIALAVIFLLNYFKLNIGMNLLIINVVLLILNNVTEKKTKLFKNFKGFAFIATYIIGIFTMISFTEMNNIFIAINSLVLIAAILFIVNKKDYEKLSLANGLLINLIILIASYSLNFAFYVDVITVITSIAVLYSLLMYTKFLIKHKEFAKTFIITANVLMLLSFVVSLEASYIPHIAYTDLEIPDIYTTLGCSVVILMTSVIYHMLMQKEDKLRYEYYLTPIKVAPVILAVGLCICNLTSVQIMVSAFLIYGLMAHFSKKSKLHEENIIITLVILFLAAFTNYSDRELFPGIIIMLTSVFTYFYSLKSKANILKQIKTPLLMFMLTVIYLTFSTNMFSYSEAYLSLIVLLSFISIMIFTRKDKLSYIITGYAVTIPVFNLIDSVIKDQDFVTMLTSTLIFYITFITCKNVIKDIKKSSLLATGVSIAVLLMIIFNGSALIGLYAAIVSLVLILIGLINDDYRSLFITGICFTIINIIYQLRNLWEVIPLWSYLLLIGLVLIGIVTYKEIKKGSKN